MSERPITFSGPMVRSILDGAKTQTRRVMKPQPVVVSDTAWPPSARWEQFFAVGDRLWVRETHALRSDIDGAVNPDKARHYAMYRADGVDDPKDIDNWHDYGRRWRPSIHMPRWASRITLEVTGVRVERLQAITEADARGEGVKTIGEAMPSIGPGQPIVCGDRSSFRAGDSPCRASFACLWDEINAKRAPWASNPWVWAITFRRVTP